MREYILQKYDRNKDGRISKAEALAVDTIELVHTGITDDILMGRVLTGSPECSLSGIEYFPNLVYLDYSINALTTLDLSKNKALRYLNLANRIDGTTGSIASLRLPKKSRIETLDISGNKLTTLDLSGSPLLKKLDCSSNDLSALDVSLCPNLLELNCSENQIGSLFLKKNRWLTWFHCESNQLTSLDLMYNPLLTKLYCAHNPLHWVGIRNELKLKELSISAPNPIFNLARFSNLEYLSCTGFRNIDVVSELKKLKSIILMDCELDKLDLSHNVELDFLWAHGNFNKIAKLDLSNIKNLQRVEFPNETVFWMTDDQYDWSEQGAELKTRWREHVRKEREQQARARETAVAAERQRKEKEQLERARKEEENAPRFNEHKKLASRAVASQDWAEAESQASKGLAIKSDAYLYLVRAMALYHREMSFDIEDDDVDMTAFFNAYQSEAKRLRTITTRSIERDGSATNPAYFYRGIAHIFLGKPYRADAVSDFKKYNAGHPDKQGAGYYNIGIANMNAGYYREAVEAFKQARTHAADEKARMQAQKRIKSCQEKIDKNSR